jgi:integrase
MAVHLLDQGFSTPLERLVEDYLISCRARGLSPRTDGQYGYALRAVFLSWCSSEGITRLDQLDRRAFDRSTSSLLQRRNRYGKPVSKYSVHSFIRPVRLLLNWATREGEEVLSRPQLPRREKPIRDVLSRDEIDLLEGAMANERDKLIIRIFADCGLRLDELTRLTAGDIVRSGRQAHLRVLGKRGRVRDVPLPPSLLRRLDRFIDTRPSERASDGIFLGYRQRGGEYTALTDIGIYQVVKDAFRRARITKSVYPPPAAALADDRDASAGDEPDPALLHRRCLHGRDCPALCPPHEGRRVRRDDPCLERQVRRVVRTIARVGTPLLPGVVGSIGSWRAAAV